MKSTKFISTLFFAFLLSFTSCFRDDDTYSNLQQQENIPDTFSQYFGNEISRDFLGTVINKNNLPIVGVTITIGNEIAVTDSNGVFIIRSTNVNKRFGYIKAEKVGYINGSRSVVPSEGTNKVTIMLLEANVAGTVNSGTSETVALADGSSVSFDGNFIKEDGSAYSGSVNVIMHHLDPADEDMPLKMPGMLYAQNENGAERMLQTLGMLAVELRGTNGEDLNLAEGSTSEIKMPVDASLMGIAPATIPLWYFDEVNGYWKEEGQATLQGNMYVGTVSHFSFWNCDIPAEAVTLCVSVIDNENNLLNGQTVHITSAIFGTRSGITDEKGEVCGFIPKNETLFLEITSPESCGDLVIFSQNIGPYDEDNNVTITIQNNAVVASETITGFVNNCDNESIENGYLVYTDDSNEIYQLITDGSFELNVTRCTSFDTFSLRVVNLDTFETSSTNEYTFNSPVTDVGVLNTCISQEEYIIYFIDNSSEVFFDDDIEVTLTENNISILRYISPGSGPKFLTDLPNELGEYVTSSANGMIFNIIYPVGISNQYLLIAPYGINIETTYIGAGVGDFIDMNFNGTFQDTSGNIHFIEGQLHVRIDE